MNEEIKREAELNEKALEDVSGGTTLGIAELASGICHRCLRKGQCRHGQTDLIRYMRQNGYDSVKKSEDCPYYNEAK